MRRLSILFWLINLFFIIEVAYCLPWPPEVDIVEISFNYESGYSYDALTIKKNNSTYVPIPEWKAGVRDENFAYIKSQTNRKIKAKFWMDRAGNYNVGVYAVKIGSGTGIGDVGENTVVFSGSQYSTPKIMSCNGTVPSSVGKRYFSWRWYVSYINQEEFFDPLLIGDSGTHDYYTLLAAPQSPMAEPWYEVLDYACSWSSGTTTSSSACIAILNNGFSAHYTWDGDCHYLSSDFVRLVTSLGISASQHRWSAILDNPDTGDMVLQKTKSIDPVGPLYGQGVQVWYFHQWSEAADAQRDPSTATSLSGSWGDYEDDLYTQYARITNYPYYEWVSNQSGHSSGCEASEHRIYSSSPYIHDWRGPDR